MGLAQIHQREMTFSHIKAKHIHRSLYGNGIYLAEKRVKYAESGKLKAAGLNAHYYVSPQTAHEWQSWRRSLYQFAQLLWK